MSDHKQFLNPSDRMLRQFAGIWIIFFGAIAFRQLSHHNRPMVALVLAALALTVGPLGVIWPRWIKPVFVGWMTLAYPIGWVVSRVVLGIVFYGLFTPVALVMHLIQRDALLLRPRPTAETYWQTKKSGADKTKYLRQY
jgi:hypothetical protein